MQTTLLGLAFGLIAALIAALVGPLFIDWNQFRPRFEAEASRVLGAELRVLGDLDARLLPTPTLRLGAVNIGGANDPGRVRIDRLAVEFSLGDLMRGEWRANELSIQGFALDLGLDQQGRIDWPMSGLAGLGALSIDRLDLAGRIALHDAASRTTLELQDIAFSGEVRSLAGVIRGDGNVRIDGARYPFRLNASRSGDGSATRLRLVFEDRARALTQEIEGQLAFEARSPRFDGAVAVVRAPSKDADSLLPWRASAKVKADPAAARLDQIEIAYGPDAAVKLTGSGEARFGPSPQLRASLSAKQLDADKLLGDAGSGVAHWLASLRGALDRLPRPPLPTALTFSAEQVILGGRPVQDIAAELSGTAKTWDLRRIEARAPGGSQLRLDDAQIGDGRLSGALSVDSADSELLVTWLSARRDTRARTPRPLRGSARIALADGTVAFDDVSVTTDNGSASGRLAYERRADGSRLEAALRADRLDLDEISEALGGLGFGFGDWPDRAAITLDAARAASAGQLFEPLALDFSYGPERFTLKQMRIGSGHELTITGRGDIDRKGVAGRLDFQADAASPTALAALLAPVAPRLAGRLDELGASAPSRLQLGLDLAPGAGARQQADFRARLQVDSGAVEGEATLTAAPALDAIRNADLDALARTEIKLDVGMEASRAAALLAPFRIGRALAADGPARLKASLTGRWPSPLRIAASLGGDDLDAGFDGALDPWSGETRASGQLAIRRARLTGAADQPASLAARLSLAAGRLSLNDVDAVLLGSRLRGKLAVDFDEMIGVDGEAGLDAVDLPRLFLLSIGAAGRPDDPISTALASGWRGKLTFSALRAMLPAGLEARSVSGALTSDGASVSLEDLKAKLGGGDAEGSLRLRAAGDGVAIDGKLQWSGVDGALLRHGALAMPSGKTALTLTLSAAGRSVSALVGALAGGGSLTIENARIAGLDPRAFEVAMRTGESGAPLDDGKLAQVVEPALAQGALSVSRAQLPFSISEGRLRVGAATLDGDGARALVSGGYDFAAGQVDMRADLQSTRLVAAGVQPEIRVFAVGTPNGLHKSVDVTGLALWLAARRIDQETGRLQALERGGPITPAVTPPPPAPPAAPSAPSEASPHPGPSPLQGAEPRRAAPRPPVRAPAPSRPQAGDPAPPLPPPVEVRPAPRPRAPLVLTPQFQ